MTRNYITINSADTSNYHIRSHTEERMIVQGLIWPIKCSTRKTNK